MNIHTVHFRFFMVTLFSLASQLNLIPSETVKTYSDNSSLHTAITTIGDPVIRLDRVKQLCAEGTQLEAPLDNQEDHFHGLTPLLIAIHCTDEPIVRELIAAKADPNNPGNHDAVPLSDAIETYYDIQENNNLNPAEKEKLSTSALSIINALLDTPGIAINDQHVLHRAPIHIAIERSGPEIVQLLLQKNAGIEATVNDIGSTIRQPNDNIHGLTPLLLAICWDSDSIVEMLLNHGADPNNKGEQETLPLTQAIESYYADKVKECEAEEKEPRSPSSLKIIDFLLSAPTIKVNTPGYMGLTPLHMAVKLGLDDIKEKLIDHGADPQAQDANGIAAIDSTPLKPSIKKQVRELVNPTKL